CIQGGVGLCQGGRCTGGTLVDCGGGNTCVIDGCNAVTGCTHTPIPNCEPPTDAGCHAYLPCRPELYNICTGSGDNRLSNCVRGCLQQFFTGCVYLDPTDPILGPSVHAYCGSFCTAIVGAGGP